MNYFAFSALVNGLTSLLLGIYVLLNNPKKALNRSYAFFAFSIFAWSFGYLFWQLAKTSAEAVFWVRILMFGAIIIPGAFFNMALFITNKYPGKRVQAWLSWFFCALFLVLNSSSLLISEKVARKLSFDFWPEPGIIYPLFLLMFFSYIFYSLFIMYQVFRKANGRLRNQIIYVFIGTGLGFLGGSTNYFLWFDIPISPVANILVVAFPLLTAYAILKHRLMDISIVISRAVAKGITILFFGSIYFGLAWLYQANVSSSLGHSFIGLTILLGIIVAQTHEKTRIFLQTTTDKLFLRGKYNYYEELQAVSSRISRSRTVAEVLETLNQTFYEVIEVSNPQIYLDKERAVSRDDLVLPCEIEGRTVATIVLGKKLTEDEYTTEDLELLRSIASQTAVTLDRLRIFEETEKMLQRLLAAEGESAQGRLVAGLAHEIKNPLAAIKGMTQSLGKNINDPVFVNDFMDVVPKEIDRLGGLIERLLILGAEVKLNLQERDINELIEESLKLFDSQIKAQGIRVEKELLPEIIVKVDPLQLSQVLTNLFLNASQAMLKGGVLTIRTNKLTDHPANQPNLSIEITDTGEGIPADKQKYIFEPFFTTKPSGMGLGLAISYKIIKDHGGEIAVESPPPGQASGTRFIIRLRVAPIVAPHPPSPRF